jgi:hypothetical protein
VPQGRQDEAAIVSVNELSGHSEQDREPAEEANELLGHAVHCPGAEWKYPALQEHVADPDELKELGQHGVQELLL